MHSLCTEGLAAYARGGGQIMNGEKGRLCAAGGQIMHGEAGRLCTVKRADYAQQAGRLCTGRGGRITWRSERGNSSSSLLSTSLLSAS